MLSPYYKYTWFLLFRQEQKEKQKIKMIFKKWEDYIGDIVYQE